MAKIHHDRQMLGEEDKLANGGGCSLFFVAMKSEMRAGMTPFRFMCFIFGVYECMREHLSKIFCLPMCVCVCDERNLAAGAF